MGKLKKLLQLRKGLFKSKKDTARTPATSSTPNTPVQSTSASVSTYLGSAFNRTPRNAIISAALGGRGSAYIVPSITRAPTPHKASVRDARRKSGPPERPVRAPTYPGSTRNLPSRKASVKDVRRTVAPGNIYLGSTRNLTARKTSVRDVRRPKRRAPPPPLNKSTLRKLGDASSVSLAPPPRRLKVPPTSRMPTPPLFNATFNELPTRYVASECHPNWTTFSSSSETSVNSCPANTCVPNSVSNEVELLAIEFATLNNVDLGEFATPNYANSGKFVDLDSPDTSQFSNPNYVSYPDDKIAQLSFDKRAKTTLDFNANSLADEIRAYAAASKDFGALSLISGSGASIPEAAAERVDTGSYNEAFQADDYNDYDATYKDIETAAYNDLRTTYLESESAAYKDYATVTYKDYETAGFADAMETVDDNIDFNYSENYSVEYSDDSYFYPASPSGVKEAPIPIHVTPDVIASTHREQAPLASSEWGVTMIESDMDEACYSFDVIPNYVPYECTVRWTNKRQRPKVAAPATTTEKFEEKWGAKVYAGNRVRHVPRSVAPPIPPRKAFPQSNTRLCVWTESTTKRAGGVRHDDFATEMKLATIKSSKSTDLTCSVSNITNIDQWADLLTLKINDLSGK